MEITDSERYLASLIRPLVWEHLGHLGSHFYKAPCPLFGSIRIERYSGRYSLHWSVPGYSNSFTDEEYDTAEETMEAAQREYVRRMTAALAIPGEGVLKIA